MIELIEPKRNYKQEVLNSMSIFDISCIINDKKKDLKEIEEDYLEFVVHKSYTVDEMEIIKLFKEDKQNEFKKIIFVLDYEIRSRNSENGPLKDFKKQIDDKKLTTSIRDIISFYIPTLNTKGNIKCPFPDHNDKTASFHIYDNTNTCRCFGCRRGGSAIDFIMEFEKCNLKTAIEKFLRF